jgi:VTC domain
MDVQVANSLARFFTTSLYDPNAKAAMLERLNNKYILPAARLRPAFEAFADLFDVLEISGKRAFTYATRYFENDDQRAYFDHHRGLRKRCMVRVRHYVDAGFSYLEVKLKDTRDVTVKKRLKVESPLMALDDRCLGFIETCYSDLYGKPFEQDRMPMIAMEYERITLVAREGGERTTIDTRLVFNGWQQPSPGQRRHVLH